MNKALFEIENVMTIKGLYSIIVLNFWDLAFKILLFLKADKIQSYRT